LHLFGIYTRPLRGPTDGSSVEERVYTHRVFEAADVAELLSCSRNPELDLDEDFVRSALSKGDVCAARLRDGAVVAYRWIAFTPTHHRQGVYVDFDPRYRYGYKTFTLPEYRGRHVLRLFTPQVDSYCMKRGRQSAICIVAVDNDPSMRFVLGTGFRRIGFAGFLRRGALFFPFRTAGVQAEGFRFFTPS